MVGRGGLDSVPDSVDDSGVIDSLHRGAADMLRADDKTLHFFRVF